MRKDLIMMLAALSVGACVEDTYDLDKDIDTSITIGGDELTTPPIKIEPLTMETILDLDEDSKVKCLTAEEANLYKLQEGDYAFIQEGDNEQANNFDMPIVTFNTDGSGMNGSVTLETTTITDAMLDKQDANKVTQSVTSDFYLDFSTSSITSELRLLEEVSVSSLLHLKFALSDAPNATVQYEPGFQIILPNALGNDIEKCTSEGFQGYTLKGHTITFDTLYKIGDGDICLQLQTLEVTDKPEAANEDKLLITYGTVAEDGTYMNDGSLTGKLKFSVNGEVYVKSNVAQTITPVLDFSASTQNNTINVTAIKGKVNTPIDVDIKRMDITGMPSSLNDPETNLLLDNPMIVLIISNPSPFNVDLGCLTLHSMKNEQETTAVTEAITVAPGENKLLISPKAVEGYTHVSCPMLPNLIARIPDSVYVDKIKAGINQGGEALNIELSTQDKPIKHSVTTKYDIVAPLTFDAGSRIHYTDTLDGLQDDLSDIDEIGDLIINADYTNNLPLNMAIPQEAIEAINKDGKKIENVTVTVNGDVKALQSGHLALTISQNGGSLKNFDGLRLKLIATPADGTKTTLNKSQTLTMHKVQLTIKGGLTLEL